MYIYMYKCTYIYIYMHIYMYIQTTKHVSGRDRSPRAPQRTEQLPKPPAPEFESI